MLCSKIVLLCLAQGFVSLSSSRKCPLLPLISCTEPFWWSPNIDLYSSYTAFLLKAFEETYSCNNFFSSSYAQLPL